MDRATDPMQLWVGTWGAAAPSPPDDRRQAQARPAPPEAAAPARAEDALDRPEVG